MKRSAELVSETPVGPVTVTLTTPVDAGDTAKSREDETKRTLVAGDVPKRTVEDEEKSDPETMTVDPPCAGPLEGRTVVTAGGGRYTYLSAFTTALVPLDVATVTLTVPADPDGTTAVIFVVEETVTLLARTVPNFTVAVDVNSVPVIVTIVPPVAGPFEGVSFVTVGAV